MSSASSLQRDLDRFFKGINNEEFSIREVTKGAFSQARQKLKPWAFKRLNEVAVNSFYSLNKVNTWFGMRVLAVDGTRLVLPNHKTVHDEFGVHGFGPNANSKNSLAIGSILYDVLNHIAIDSEIAPYASSERTLFYSHLDHTKPNDLILLDRGYPSFAIFFIMLARGLHFCVRMKKDWWLSVKEFYESDLMEGVIELKLPKKDHELLNNYPEWVNKTIKCRLIRVVLPDGEDEILCTSLIDSEKFPHEVFKELYHYRWSIEEAYKLLKARLKLEDFSGKTAIAVKQDFFAKVLLLSLCSILSHPVGEEVKKKYKKGAGRKFSQKINWASALANTRDSLIHIFIKKSFKRILMYYDDIVEKTREIIRPDRSVPRNHKKKKPCSMNYKIL